MVLRHVRSERAELPTGPVVRHVVDVDGLEVSVDERPGGLCSLGPAQKAIREKFGDPARAAFANMWGEFWAKLPDGEVTPRDGDQ